MYRPRCSGRVTINPRRWKPLSPAAPGRGNRPGNQRHADDPATGGSRHMAAAHSGPGGAPRALSPSVPTIRSPRLPDLDPAPIQAVVTTQHTHVSVPRASAVAVVQFPRTANPSGRSERIHDWGGLGVLWAPGADNDLGGMWNNEGSAYYSRSWGRTSLPMYRSSQRLRRTWI